jgi:WD40 repeat protein
MKNMNGIMPRTRTVYFLSTILLVTAFLITSTVAFANQWEEMEVMTFMSLIDYDAYHNQLIDHCASRFPETAQSLRTAITQWSKKNLPALKEIRSLLDEEMIDQGIPEKDLEERSAQAVAKMTQTMNKNLAAMPDSELKSTCSGKYAEQLGSLDYVVFLEKIKTELNQKRSEISTNQKKHEKNTNQEERQIIQLVDEKSVVKGIRAVAWSPDGKSIATVGQRMQVTIWDAATLSIRHQFNKDFEGYCFDNITFSPDSQYVASGRKIVNVWKVSDESIQATLIAPHVTPDKPQFIGIRSLRFSPDGKLVILGESEYSGYIGNSKILCRVLLLDAATGKLLRSIDNIHVEAPMALALSPDGKWVATGTHTGSIESGSRGHLENKDPVRIWNLETGKLAKELPLKCAAASLAFSKDGKYLFGAKCDNLNHLTLAVWDVVSGNMVQAIRNNPKPSSLVVSPDGKRLAAAGEDKLSIYEITTSK